MEHESRDMLRGKRAQDISGSACDRPPLAPGRGGCGGRFSVTFCSSPPGPPSSVFLRFTGPWKALFVKHLEQHLKLKVIPPEHPRQELPAVPTYQHDILDWAFFLKGPDGNYFRLRGPSLMSHSKKKKESEGSWLDVARVCRALCEAPNAGLAGIRGLPTVL